ncbi:dienelactone hydrolase family protein [Uliginosibacterium aquaticum]|uniref:Dienelactone hydrolase family protein n=1 Tax=Uliginosibacterium aquaticum TaxID=2731212 RepID=A0ABX2IBS6_9RHOO|nr:dienelactone hydrolase family protein [Uliginosibacterium aquaticum]NSL53894.1 dienelactone hydrolase family protein [Uliginosibacterium aquaticum]
MRTALAGLWLTLELLSSPAQAATPVPVTLPTAGLSSAPAPLAGFVFQPASPGPHPAVVMLHGCGGAYAKDGTLNARHRMWGEFLAAHGYLALMLDSLGARGIKELCTQKFSERSLKEADRRGDAYAALAYLRSRSDVDGQRIGLLGWSHGGGVTLDTITHAPRTGSGFAAAVSFYPGCSSKAKKAEAFKPYAPLLLLIGEADDWTPAAPCKVLAAAATARGETMQIVTYPDTYHDFDNPALTQKRVRKDVPNGVNPGQGTTTAPNPEAREDAQQRVLAFFAQELK